MDVLLRDKLCFTVSFDTYEKEKASGKACSYDTFCNE